MTRPDVLCALKFYLKCVTFCETVNCLHIYNYVNDIGMRDIRWINEVIYISLLPMKDETT